jgi:hypothetical protein
VNDTSIKTRNQPSSGTEKVQVRGLTSKNSANRENISARTAIPTICNENFSNNLAPHFDYLPCKSALNRAFGVSILELTPCNTFSSHRLSQFASTV